MPSTSTRVVCVSCRAVGQGGAAHDACAGPVLTVTARWRAPRRGNDTAWARVAAGELLWDRRAVQRSARRAARRRADAQARARAEQRAAADLGTTSLAMKRLRREVLEGRASDQDAALARRWADAVDGHLERTAQRR